VLLAKALQKQGVVEYRRNRALQRTRGSSNGATKQQTRRRQEGKDGGGKDGGGKSGSGKSGGSGSSSGGGSSGGSSSGGSSGSSGGSSSSSGGSSSSTSVSGNERNQAGWSSYDGSYCGCLCFDDSDMSGVYNHGLSCDFSVFENSYGYGESDVQPDNSDSFSENFFQYNQLTSWSTVDESAATDDYFTNSGYTNGDWETYDGRTDQTDAPVDDAAQEEEEEAEQEEEAEVVVVNELDSGYDPYEAFDIGKCDTYAHLWTYDLFVSCASGDKNCECTYTEELLAMGLLTCSDVSSCPTECGVCANCLNSVCAQFLPSHIVASGIGGNTMFVTAAVFGTVLLATCVAYRQHQQEKNPKGGKLGESLMDDNGVLYTSRNWKVTLDKNGQPTTKKDKKKGTTTKQVWLAPDVSTIPVKPLFPDLLKRDSEFESETDSDEDEEYQNQYQQPNYSPPKTAEDPPEHRPTTRKEIRCPGPLIVTSGDDVSIPSSISCGLDGKSLETKEGEI